jgi:hypothetical protein
VVAAFADRKDVKVDDKGKLRIRHKGGAAGSPTCPL